MVGPIRPSGATGTSAIGSGGSTRNGNRTGSALRKLAGKVAGRFAREFRLLDGEQESEGDQRESFRDGEDIYDVIGTARELGGELNARPVDEGLLARSLDGFVQESAVLLAARPGAASLDTIARVICAHETSRETETLAGSIAQIDQTAREIAGSSPGTSGRAPRS